MILCMKATTFYKKQANEHDDKTSENIVFVAVNGTLFKVTDFSSFLKL